MLIQEVKEIFQDKAHIFQDSYFEGFHISVLTILYRSEHTNHDTLRHILYYFKIFTNSSKSFL